MEQRGMRKHGMVAILTLIIAVTLTSCADNPDLEGKSPEYRKAYAAGIEEANAEIEADSMTIYTYGFGSIMPDRKDIDQNTGLPCKHIAGCLVTDEILGRADGHNKRIMEHLGRDAP
jgi:hypothetical protein